MNTQWRQHFFRFDQDLELGILDDDSIYILYIFVKKNNKAGICIVRDIWYLHFSNYKSI